MPVDCNGREKNYNLSQVIPAPAAQDDRALQRLLSRMELFSFNPPPGIMITEVPHPADRRGRSGIFDEAKVKELAGLPGRGVYKVPCGF